MIATSRRDALRTLATKARGVSVTSDAWGGLVERSRATTALAGIERSVIDGSLVVDTATDAASDVWPDDYVEAFQRLGLDKTYGVEQQAGLYGLFDHLTQDQLDGLTSTVKGTVLEIRVREMAQAGELPGLENTPADAFLSESLTQQGHDVEIVDGSGEVIDKIQVKAGEWSNFSGRVDEYAEQGIPIAVTSEAAARASDAGHAADVIDTGISSADLNSQTANIIDNLGLGHSVDEMVPELALVMLATAAAMRLRSGQSAAQVRGWVAEELQNLGVANSAGLAVSVMTGMAALRPVAALGAKWTLARARTASEVTVSVSRLSEQLLTVRAP